jgi:hypothetical protein
VLLEVNLDGSRTEYFDMEPTEEGLLALFRTLFLEHYREIVFGPLLQGAVFEITFREAPRFAYLDGYLTCGPEDSWHFHLCLGAHQGTQARPTPPELAAWRRCARAAFFRDSRPEGPPSSWGLRLWNGRDEQMITILFPNPWLNDARTKLVKTPDWPRLDLWMRLRAEYAHVPAEPPPTGTERPVTH